jgi:TPR repeat protein
LEWPTQDVEQIAVELQKIGFETTVHKDVTDQDFRKVTAEFLANQGREEGAQLLVYYAGHGHTEKGALGRSLGYIVMSNTPLPQQDYAGFDATSVSMQWFLTYAQKLTARHVMFVFDSCFSGAMLNVRSQPAPEPIREFVAKPVREFLTAGSADEPVPDRSIFKSVLVRVLTGEIEEPIEDGYLTGEELGLLMKTTVPEYYPNQHPQYGKMLDAELDEGDFVFILKRHGQRSVDADLPHVANPEIPNVEADVNFSEGENAYNDGDYTSALKYFETSAKGGNDESMTYVGFIYFEGQGVERDYKKALEWFQKAAEAGNTSAMNNLGFMYKEGLGVEKDIAQTVHWLDAAAQNGEPGAMYNLGVMYQLGDGVKRDCEKAFGLFRQAAEVGDTKAMNNLAHLYLLGLGVEQNEDEALKWYEKAVDAGDPTAMYNLASLYFEGKVIPQDHEEALWLYREAANGGSASAMNSLGHMYKEGLAVLQDYEEAISWFRKAIEAGCISAMNNLGYMYEKGFGVAANLDEAFEWYQRGAEANDPASMCNLGRIYETGLAGTQDLAKALEWYSKAASLGHEHAKERLAKLRNPT